MTKFFFFFICLLFAFNSNAEIIPKEKETIHSRWKIDSLLQKSYLILGYDNLRSTHIDRFKGFKMMVGYNFTPKFSLGIEVKDIFDPKHDDNGWKLTNIRLVPVVLDARYILGNNKYILPFAEFSTGITFLKYLKQVKAAPGEPIYEVYETFNYGAPFVVKEKGLYTYFGTGAYLKVSKHFMPFFGIGFIGYKMSLNVYDVNPHGITFEVGCKF